ncbi:hypothetical protein [Elstera sp.]|uniref:hypothetical protein n=1 Tax=Elstera sp. TaxID=1916664 RepID=UPI0037C1100D
MDYRTQLITLAREYSRLVGLSEARISTLIVNQGGLFGRLRAGKTCTVDTFLAVKRWFADHWPDQHPWPPGVDRWGLDDPAPPDLSDPPDPTCKPGLQVEGSAAA